MVTFVVLVLELTSTRLFAYIGSSHATSTAVSIALLGLGVGTAFGVMAISGKHDTDQACAAKNQCSGTAFDTRTAAYHDGNVATALFVVGGVALATGITLAIVAPRRARPAAELAVGPGTATLRGAF